MNTQKVDLSNDRALEDIGESKSIESPEVVTKYKTAAEAVNKAFLHVKEAVKPNVSVLELCKLGDSQILEYTSGVFNKAKTATGEKVDKGIAFPTCVCVNACVSHFSPLSDEDTELLKEGDLISIQMGAHIDGYCAVLCNTLFVNADLVVAVYTAAEAALRMLRPGRTNTEISEIFAKIADAYDCRIVEGCLSHQMKRHVIDGNKVVLAKPTFDQKVDIYEFQENEVYAIDIAMSTGEGKTREQGTRCTIYKRRVDIEYNLKMKTSRAVFNEINTKYPTLPFCLRSLADEKKAKLGITELLTHNLVVSYPVLYEREGVFVCRAKFTALILPSQTLRITEFSMPSCQSEKTLSDETVKAVLKTSVSKKAQKKKKKPEKLNSQQVHEEPVPMETDERNA
ncbi:ERBB-3 BINDING PROTEIN 1 [Galdieria sulphuraria]|nr:ERBB-3 BINDING PROTEIN 1 [Galdieria sulphuraria]